MADKTEQKLTVEEKTLKAKELYGKGCRDYYVKNYSEAADTLSDATELYVELYGVDGEELGEVYLLYAKALIAVAQDENKLMDIQEDDEDDDENEEECAENDSKDPENAAENESKDPEKVAESESKDPEKAAESESKDPEKVAESELKDPDEKMKDPEEKPKEVDSKSESELKNSETAKVLTNGCHSDEAKDPEQQAGPSDENKPAEAEEEDPSNLEVAWEVLQNAAAIFQRQNEKGLSKLLDVYNEMAGVSIENENFAVALEDYARALATFEQIEDSQKNHRIAAEIHYRVGLCLTLEKSFDESIKSFQKAHDLLSDVIEKEKSKEQTDEVVASIKDMEETKQEILNKINETGDIKADEVENIKKELAKFCSKVNGTADSSKDQQSSEVASDISHLIKRKKPDVGDSNVESSPAKKQVIEADEEIKAVPADDEKKKIEEEESVQPAVKN